MRLVYWALIDAAAIALFALLARLAHGGLSLSSWADTVWPFWVGVFAGWSIAYNLVKGFWGRGVLVWVCTVGIGLGIWAMRHGELPHWSFIIVASVMSGILMFGWRGVAAWAGGRKGAKSLT